MLAVDTARSYTVFLYCNESATYRSWFLPLLKHKISLHSVFVSISKGPRACKRYFPGFYLKGISIGDFSETLAALLGKNAKGLSAGTISRLKQCWVNEYDAWRKRDLSKESYVYIWADCIYFNRRMIQSMYSGHYWCDESR